MAKLTPPKKRPPSRMPPGTGGTGEPDFKNPDEAFEALTDDLEKARPKDPNADNVGLQLLYFGWAMQHLQLVDKALKLLNSDSNINMHGPLEALMGARAKMCKDPLYAHASQVLEVLTNRGAILDHLPQELAIVTSNANGLGPREEGEDEPRRAVSGFLEIAQGE